MPYVTFRGIWAGWLVFGGMLIIIGPYKQYTFYGFTLECHFCYSCASVQGLVYGASNLLHYKKMLQKMQMMNGNSMMEFVDSTTKHWHSVASIYFNLAITTHDLMLQHEVNLKSICHINDWKIPNWKLRNKCQI